MQKIRGTFLFLLCIFWNNVFINAQFPETLLSSADSAFASGKYIESFKHYEKIFSEEYYTSQMLLKMAYIKEALGDYTKALYYLNIYYFFELDRKALKKMENLAKTHQLSGYKYSDKEYFISLYNSSFLYISTVLLVISYIVFFMFFLRKKRYLNFSSMLFFIVLLACLVYVTNYRIDSSKGIIQLNKTCLMEAPSAGSLLVEVLNKGHRVEVLSKKDIWYHVKWKDKKAYIRQSNLLLVP